MAWTAPRTWATGELVTAAMQNSHVRDNLRYLKGLDGTVTIESALIVAAASASLKANATSGNPVYYWSTAGTDQYHAYYDLAAGYFGIVESGVATRMAIKDGGNVGIGNTNPQGKLHVTGSIGHTATWDYDGVDGTARTVIADGTGDVTIGLICAALIKPSSGGATGILVPLTNVVTPSTSLNLFSSSPDILTLAVAANGSATVQRTGGSLTYKVTLFLMWM